MLKIGFGYDLHRLAAGRPLVLGGTEIPFSKGLAGHSDGDCLIHAVIDALLGAVGEGDIGQFFPDSDPAYKNIRSLELLKSVMAHLRSEGWEIVNIDTVVVAEEPQLGPYTEKMKEVLCPVVGVGKSALGIKAKTNEGLGLIGQGKAMACWAVALIQRR